MSRVPSVINIYLRDRFNILAMPWIVLFISFSINVLIGAMGAIEVYTGGMTSIFAYMFFIGVYFPSATFPFALGFGVTRKDFTVGSLLVMAALSASFGILLWLLALVEQYVIPDWGIDLHFFQIPYFSDGSQLARLWVLVGLQLHMALSGMFLAALFRRFGRTGMYSLVIIVIVGLTLAIFYVTSYDYWDNIGRFFQEQTMAGLVSRISLLTAAYAAAIWAMLRRATV